MRCAASEAVCQAAPRHFPSFPLRLSRWGRSARPPRPAGGAHRGEAPQQAPAILQRAAMQHTPSPTSLKDFFTSTRECQCAMGFRGYASISFQWSLPRPSALIPTRQTPMISLWPTLRKRQRARPALGTRHAFRKGGPGVWDSAQQNAELRRAAGCQREGHFAQPPRVDSGRRQMSIRW